MSWNGMKLAHVSRPKRTDERPYKREPDVYYLPPEEIDQYLRDTYGDKLDEQRQRDKNYKAVMRGGSFSPRAK